MISKINLKKTHHLQVPYDNLGWNKFSSLNPHSAHAPAIPLHDFPVPVVQFGDEIEKGGATIKAQSEIGNHDIHVDLHVATCHAAKTGGKDVTRTVGFTAINKTMTMPLKKDNGIATYNCLRSDTVFDKRIHFQFNGQIQ